MSPFVTEDTLLTEVFSQNWEKYCINSVVDREYSFLALKPINLLCLQWNYAPTSD